MTANDWLQPGAEAVILQPWDRAALRAEKVTIERVLKRDVVLSNGERFHRDNLRKQIGGTWGTTLFLVPVTDPRVDETRARIRYSRARARAAATYDGWRMGDHTAAEVAAAFTALAEFDGSPASRSNR